MARRTMLLRTVLILTAGGTRTRCVWSGARGRSSRGVLVIITRRRVLLVPMRVLRLLPEQQVPVAVEQMALLEALAKSLQLLGSDGEDTLLLHADRSPQRIWRNRFSRG